MDQNEIFRMIGEIYVNYQTLLSRSTKEIESLKIMLGKLGEENESLKGDILLLTTKLKQKLGASNGIMET